MICEVCGLDKAARAQDVFGYTVCDDCAVIIHDKFLAGLHDMVNPPAVEPTNIDPVTGKPYVDPVTGRPYVDPVTGRPYVEPITPIQPGVIAPVNTIAQAQAQAKADAKAKAKAAAAVAAKADADAAAAEAKAEGLT